MKMQAINHVTLIARNLDIIKPYYEKVFGFSCFIIPGRGGRSLQLECGNIHFSIVETPGIDSEFIRKQHICLEVEDLVPVRDILDSLNMHYQLGYYTGFKNQNYLMCEWRDPEGIRIECIEQTNTLS